MKSLDERMNLFLLERRKTTRVEMTKAERTLKIDKSKDVGMNLYVDMTEFMATYLNSLETKELANYKVMNREKAEQLVAAMTEAHPNAQALLKKLNLDPKGFVSRYWSKMDMKTAIQDAVVLLMRGEKVSVAAPEKGEKVAGRFKARNVKEDTDTEE